MLIDPKIEKKIDDLIAQMTLEEKIGQICQVGPSPVGGLVAGEGSLTAEGRSGSFSCPLRPLTGGDSPPRRPCSAG